MLACCLIVIRYLKEGETIELTLVVLAFAQAKIHELERETEHRERKFKVQSAKAELENEERMLLLLDQSIAVCAMHSILQAFTLDIKLTASFLFLFLLMCVPK